MQTSNVALSQSPISEGGGGVMSRMGNDRVMSRSGGGEAGRECPGGKRRGRRGRGRRRGDRLIPYYRYSIMYSIYVGTR